MARLYSQPAQSTRRIVTITDAATLTPNIATTDVALVTLGGNRTLASPDGSPTDAQQFQIRLKQDGAGNRTLTFDSVYRFSDDLPQPTLSGDPSATDYVMFQYNAADSKWDCVAVNRGF